MLEVSWVDIALLIADVAVAGGLTYLLLVSHRKQSQETRSAQPSARCQISTADPGMPSGGRMHHCADGSEHGVSEPCVASGAKEVHSADQTCGFIAAAGIQVQPTHPQEPARVGESDSKELPSKRKLKTEQDLIPLSVEASSKTQTAEESSAEQLAERDLGGDGVWPTTPVPEEESQSWGGETPSTNRSQEAETSLTDLKFLENEVPIDSTESERDDGEKEESNKAEKPEHETQCPSPATGADLIQDQHLAKPAPGPRVSEVGATCEQDVSILGDLSITRRHAAVEEHGDAVPETIEEEKGETPTEAGDSLQVPIAHVEKSASIKRKPDTKLRQSVAPSRPRARDSKKDKYKAKSRRKQEPPKQPSRTRLEESADAEPLFAEVPEITEQIERHRTRFPPRPGRYRPPSQEPVTVPQPSRKRQPMRQVRQQSLDLTLRLLFQRSGHFKLGLLPQRGPQLPEEIVLGPEGNSHTVAAVHDDWYEDVYPENLSTLLIKGVSWCQ